MNVSKCGTRRPREENHWLAGITGPRLHHYAEQSPLNLATDHLDSLRPPTDLLMMLRRRTPLNIREQSGSAPFCVSTC